MTFLQLEPPRFCSDLLVMNGRVPSFTVEGDRKSFVRRLRALGRIFSAWPSWCVVMPEFEPITGRYVYVVDVVGVRKRVHFEEPGEGRPLLCLHTAGADLRQHRRLLCDSELTKKWHVVAFDMPRHGRSLPSEGWWEKGYLLTTDDAPESTVYTPRRERRNEER